MIVSRVLVFRFPAEQFLGPGGVGVEGDRVAGAAGAVRHGHFLARHLFRGRDDLRYGKAVAGAEIAEDRLAWREASPSRRCGRRPGRRRGCSRGRWCRPWWGNRCRRR